MRYSIRAALQSLYRERWINLLSVLSMATSLLIIAIASITLYNIDHFSKKLPERFSMVIYLKDDLSESERQDLLLTIKKKGLVAAVRYISKDEALKELRSSLKEADYILEGLKENPLPASIEVRLKKEAVSPDKVAMFVSSLRGIKGVEDVQYGEGFLLSLNSLKRGLETAGVVVTAIMVIATVFISYSTVKILFYRKKEEIETLKLLGATRGFIRIPFLIEGGVIGFTGGLISMIFLFLFYYLLFLRLGSTMPIINRAVLYPSMFAPIAVVGLFLGIIGALIAVGRIRY